MKSKTVRAGTAEVADTALVAGTAVVAVGIPADAGAPSRVLAPEAPEGVSVAPHAPTTSPMASVTATARPDDRRADPAPVEASSLAARGGLALATVAAPIDDLVIART